MLSRKLLILLFRYLTSPAGSQLRPFLLFEQELRLTSPLQKFRLTVDCGFGPRYSNIAFQAQENLLFHRILRYTLN